MEMGPNSQSKLFQKLQKAHFRKEYDELALAGSSRGEEGGDGVDNPNWNGTT